MNQFVFFKTIASQGRDAHYDRACMMPGLICCSVNYSLENTVKEPPGYCRVHHCV